MCGVALHLGEEADFLFAEAHAGELSAGLVVEELAEGQVEGAATQGLGYALTEEVQIGPDGHVLNPSFMDYKIFCADDMPKLTTILVEAEEPTVPVDPQEVIILMRSLCGSEATRIH